MATDDFFAPPPFQPDAALVGLRRQLRELRELKLTERAGTDAARFEWSGSPVLELRAEPDHLAARLVRRPARTPEWDSRSLRSAADVRGLVAELRRRLARWGDDRD